MKRFISLIFAICLCVSSFAQFNTSMLLDLEQSELAKSFKEHISYLSSPSLEGRKGGSEGEKEAAIYLSAVLSDYGLEVLSGKEGEVFGIKRMESDTLVSRNVIAFIPGYDEKLRDNYVVIGARLDNLGKRVVNIDGESQEKVFYGANGNASGLAMLLELANRLQTNSVLLKRSVIIAAFGANENLGAGAWYFLNRSFGGSSNIDAMINLDMLGTGSNGFYAYTASNRDLNDKLHSLKGTLQPLHPEIVAQEPVNSCHRTFYDKEIPAVFFTTGMYPEYNSDRDTEDVIEYDFMEREMEYIYNFAIELVNGEAPEFRSSNEVNKRYSSGDVFSYSDCDTKPVFLGSSDPSVFLSQWVYKYLRYPKEAVEAGVQGRVLVNFVIDEKGKVGQAKVVKGISPALDAEALRVVNASPDWKPGRINGQKVKCELSLYIDFRLEKR